MIEGKLNYFAEQTHNKDITTEFANNMTIMSN